MGDKPGHYWDLRQARWVKFEPPVVELPEQADPRDDSVPAERDDQVARPQEADVRSG
jgi:hypothetical protein